MKPIVECVSGKGSTNYCMIQIRLFPTLLKLRSPSYRGMVVYTILDSAKWQVAWQTCYSACFVGSPQLCCQSVQEGCKLMLISFCWSEYSNSLPGFPFWYARLPVEYVIELRGKKDFIFYVGIYGSESPPEAVTLLVHGSQVWSSAQEHELQARGCCHPAYENKNDTSPS